MFRPLMNLKEYFKHAQKYLHCTIYSYFDENYTQFKNNCFGKIFWVNEVNKLCFIIFLKLHIGTTIYINIW